MDYKLISFGIICLTIFLIGSEAPSVKLTNAKCESYNKSWVIMHTCRLKAHSRNKTSLNVNLTVLEPAYKISAKFKMWKRANGYKPFLFDFHLDCCEFLRRRNHPVGKIIYNLLKDSSTVNHSCPYMGVQTLSDFHRIELPVVLPSGEYLVTFIWMFDGKPQFSSNISFTYLEDLWTRN
ncbi:uncharacterized protein [Drosophila pseudoobscura]|uniref:MD-2-related lipid-recognition domain-containing protein n=1 Tax=Drosophila pseudoobscura pseudoobscura TaxID=46245 RepID=A0A6I8VMS8_DROPS|nr:uncharacterized protein LOC6896813 [Drosophila pseudoobscura]